MSATLLVLCELPRRSSVVENESSNTPLSAVGATTTTTRWVAVRTDDVQEAFLQLKGRNRDEDAATKLRHSNQQNDHFSSPSRSLRALVAAHICRQVYTTQQVNSAVPPPPHKRERSGSGNTCGDVDTIINKNDDDDVGGSEDHDVEEGVVVVTADIPRTRAQINDPDPDQLIHIIAWYENGTVYLTKSGEKRGAELSDGDEEEPVVVRQIPGERMLSPLYLLDLNIYGDEAEVHHNHKDMVVVEDASLLNKDIKGFCKQHGMSVSQFVAWGGCADLPAPVVAIVNSPPLRTDAKEKKKTQRSDEEGTYQYFVPVFESHFDITRSDVKKKSRSQNIKKSFFTPLPACVSTVEEWMHHLVEERGTNEAATDTDEPTATAEVQESGKEEEEEEDVEDEEEINKQIEQISSIVANALTKATAAKEAGNASLVSFMRQQQQQKGASKATSTGLSNAQEESIRELLQQSTQHYKKGLYDLQIALTTLNVRRSVLDEAIENTKAKAKAKVLKQQQEEQQVATLAAAASGSDRQQQQHKQKLDQYQEVLSTLEYTAAVLLSNLSQVYLYKRQQLQLKQRSSEAEEEAQTQREQDCEEEEEEEEGYDDGPKLDREMYLSNKAHRYAERSIALLLRLRKAAAAAGAEGAETFRWWEDADEKNGEKREQHKLLLDCLTLLCKVYFRSAQALDMHKHSDSHSDPIRDDDKKKKNHKRKGNQSDLWAEVIHEKYAKALEQAEEQHSVIARMTKKAAEEAGKLQKVPPLPLPAPVDTSAIRQGFERWKAVIAAQKARDKKMFSKFFAH